MKKVSQREERQAMTLTSGALSWIKVSKHLLGLTVRRSHLRFLEESILVKNGMLVVILSD